MDNDQSVLAQSVKAASAYVAHNPMSPEEYTKFLKNLYQTLSSTDASLGAGAPDDQAGDAIQPDAKPQALKPAVAIEKSISHDLLTCIECGHRGKLMKRHLRDKHGLSPEDYRAKWSLPSDYPMTAPGYADRRSEIAKEIGLGVKKPLDS